MVRAFVKGEAGEKGVPSWSWAGVVGAKVFWRTEWQFFFPSRNLVEGVDDGVEGGQTDGRTLFVRGAKLRKVRVRRLERDEEESQPAFMAEGGSRVWSPEALFIALRRNRSLHMPVHSILSDDDPITAADHTRAVGLAAFDRHADEEKPGLSTREIYAVPMVESPRFAFDPFLLEGGGTEWHGHNISEKVLFGDVNNPEPDGAIEFYPAQGVRERPVPRRYNMIARVSEGMDRPVGYYTPPSPEEAQVCTFHGLGVKKAFKLLTR
jgi:hypothetical protein